MFNKYPNPKPKSKSAEVAKPSVIVGPYGHCLGPGHEGKVISTQYGAAISNRRSPE